jgi:hypothetical protein
MSGLESQSCCPKRKTYIDVLPCCSTDVAALELEPLKSRFCQCVDLLGMGADLMHHASPINFRDIEGTLPSVRVNDSSHILIPRTTMGRPWFFLPESTRLMGIPVQCMCWSS